MYIIKTGNLNVEIPPFKSLKMKFLVTRKILKQSPIPLISAFNQGPAHPLLDLSPIKAMLKKCIGHFIRGYKSLTNSKKTLNILRFSF